MARAGGNTESTPEAAPARAREIVELERLPPPADDAVEAPVWWRRPLLMLCGALVAAIAGASVVAYVVNRPDGETTTLNTGGPIVQLDVVGRGLQQITRGADGDAALWAIILRNPSSDLAAVDARLTVRLYDDTGRAVAIVDDAIPVVLPGQRAAAIGEVPATSATRVEVDVRSVGSRIVTRPPLITSSQIKVDSQGVAAKVTATLTSQFDRRLTNSLIVAVVRDDQGIIVGGGTTQLGILDPGRPVQVDINARAAPKRATSADVYVLASDIDELSR